MADYSREQMYEAMRRADAAGDAEAVKAIAAALNAGASKSEVQDLAQQNNLALNEADLDANIASRDAGGPVNTVLPPERSLGGDLATGLQSSAAGMAQGAAGFFDLPLALAKNVNVGVTDALGAGGNALLNAVGMEDAADWWRRGAGIHANALANTEGVSDLIEGVSPTPEGMEGSRFASQLIGGLAVPFGPKAKPRPQSVKNALQEIPKDEAAQIVRDGQREGVRVMTSDVRPPRGFIGKVARATGERIPIAGTGGPRVAQNEERVNAVRNLARDFGVDSSEEVLTEVADDLARTRGGRIAALSQRKNAVIDGLSGAVETPQAVAKIDEQIANLKRIGNPKLDRVIRELEQFKGVLTSGKSLREIEENRKILGDMFDDPDLASVKSVGQKAINSIYAPLRDDMGAFIKSSGGAEAHKSWQEANKQLAAMAGELDASTFKRVLSDAETTPENVARLLFSKKPSDVRRLYANLSKQGKEKAKAAVLHEALTKAGGLDDVSPQRFANALKAFGERTGIIFGDDAPRIEGVVRLLRATQRASEAAAAPPTGVQNAPIFGAALLTDWLGSAGGATASAAMAGAAARIYESAPVRNMLINLSRTKPGSPQEARLFERIDKVLASQSGIHGNIAGANDNLSTIAGAAASGGAEANRNQ